MSNASWLDRDDQCIVTLPQNCENYNLKNIETILKKEKEKRVRQGVKKLQTIAQTPKARESLKIFHEQLEREEQVKTPEVTTTVTPKRPKPLRESILEAEEGTSSMDELIESDMESQIQILQIQNDELSDEKDRLSERNDEFVEKINELDGKNEVLSHVVLGLRKEVDDLSIQLTESEEELANLTKENERLKSQPSTPPRPPPAPPSPTASEAELRKSITQLERANTQLRKQIEELRKDNESIKIENENIQETNKSLREKLSNRTRELSRIKEENETIKNDNEDLKLNINNIQDQLEELRRDNTKLFRLLEKEQDKFRRAMDFVKQVQDENAKIVNTVQGLIREQRLPEFNIS